MCIINIWYYFETMNKYCRVKSFWKYVSFNLVQSLIVCYLNKVLTIYMVWALCTQSCTVKDFISRGRFAYMYVWKYPCDVVRISLGAILCGVWDALISVLFSCWVPYCAECETRWSQYSSHAGCHTVWSVRHADLSTLLMLGAILCGVWDTLISVLFSCWVPYCVECETRWSQYSSHAGCHTVRSVRRADLSTLLMLGAILCGVWDALISVLFSCWVPYCAECETRWSQYSSHAGCHTVWSVRRADLSTLLMLGAILCGVRDVLISVLFSCWVPYCAECETRWSQYSSHAGCHTVRSVRRADLSTLLMLGAILCGVWDALISVLFSCWVPYCVECETRWSQYSSHAGCHTVWSVRRADLSTLLMLGAILCGVWDALISVLFSCWVPYCVECETYWSQYSSHAGWCGQEYEISNVMILWNSKNILSCGYYGDMTVCDIIIVDIETRRTPVMDKKKWHTEAV